MLAVFPYYPYKNVLQFQIKPFKPFYLRTHGLDFPPFPFISFNSPTLETILFAKLMFAQPWISQKDRERIQTVLTMSPLSWQKEKQISCFTINYCRR